MIKPHRRNVLTGLCGCALVGLTGCVTAQAPDGPMQAGYKPATNTDEGGIWHVMDKAEADTKRSRHLMRDPAWNAYLRDVVNRLAPELSDDMRVYLMRTAYFNASMAPNGMMQVWSGMLVRMEDEAQMAAVLGHEIGHYQKRHSLARMRALRSRADFGIFLGLAFGLAGSIAQLALLADVYAFTRDQEREADDVGIELMQKAGYEPIAASEVWANIVEESNADPNKQSPSFLLATHPSSEERTKTLRDRAKVLGAGDRHRERYAAALMSIRSILLEDELRLRQPERSLALFKRLQKAEPKNGELLFCEGEVYRLRDADKDRDLAIEAYTRAADADAPPPILWRSLGLVEQKRGNDEAARTAFKRYLELRPNADDRYLYMKHIGLTA